MKKEIAINYAKRLHKKYALSLPVNLKKIAKKYAKLKFENIPFEIDGISANLKVPGITPTILVNKNQPIKRQRFTLAHEIGHVIIPWHTGTIFDITNPHIPDGAIDYWDMEAEANAFATELLMPESWVLNLIHNNDDIGCINEIISNEADVSHLASCLRLRSLLHSGYIFIVKDSEGIVTYAGKTDGTYSDAPRTGEDIVIEEKYPFAESIYQFDTYWGQYNWVKLPLTIPLPSQDSSSDWREIIELLLSDIGCDNNQKIKYKQQINGVFGYANGVVKRGEYDKEILYSACIQRFSSKSYLNKIIEHPLFHDYLTAKICDLINNNNTNK